MTSKRLQYVDAVGLAWDADTSETKHGPLGFVSV